MPFDVTSENSGENSGTDSDAPHPGTAIPPAERARRLSRFLQARFRIDLFSALVERDFERRLAEAILAAEQDAFRRGQESAFDRRTAFPPETRAAILPHPLPSADEAGSRAA